SGPEASPGLLARTARHCRYPRPRTRRSMQAKRTIFPNKILPYMLLVPQLAVTLIFFIWPALQALKSSFEREDPFGFRTTFVWFENYRRLFIDPNYVGSLSKTAVFAFSVTVLSMT